MAEAAVLAVLPEAGHQPARAEAAAPPQAGHSRCLVPWNSQQRRLPDVPPRRLGVGLAEAVGLAEVVAP